MVKVGVVLDKKELETLPVGDIILTILQQWKRRCDVSVREFCKASVAVGNLQVTEVLKRAQSCTQSPCQGTEGNKGKERTLLETAGWTYDEGHERGPHQMGRSQRNGEEVHQVGRSQCQRNGEEVHQMGRSQCQRNGEEEYQTTARSLRSGSEGSLRGTWRQPEYEDDKVWVGIVRTTRCGWAL